MVKIKETKVTLLEDGKVVGELNTTAQLYNIRVQIKRQGRAGCSISWEGDEIFLVEDIDFQGCIQCYFSKEPGIKCAQPPELDCTQLRHHHWEIKGRVFKPVCKHHKCNKPASSKLKKKGYCSYTCMAFDKVLPKRNNE